jgi:preprotein translocase subunit SecD
MHKFNQNLYYRSFKQYAFWILLLIIFLLFRDIQLSAETTSISQPVSKLESSFICPLAGLEMWFKVTPLQENSRLTPDTINVVTRIMKQRLNSLKLANLSDEKAAVILMDKDKILVQFQPGKTPQGEPGTDPQKIERVLLKRGYLEFRKQKPGTKKQLSLFLQERDYILNQLAKLRREVPLKPNEFIENREFLETKLQENNRVLNNIFEATKLTSRYIKYAESEPQIIIGEYWNLSISFDAEGSKLFAKLTKTLAGTKRSVGIFIDNELITTPIVGAEYKKTGITNGKAWITGKFTAENIEELAIQLRFGALPARLENYSVDVARNNRCLGNSKSL